MENISTESPGYNCKSFYNQLFGKEKHKKTFVDFASDKRVCLIDSINLRVLFTFNTTITFK